MSKLQDVNNKQHNYAAEEKPDRTKTFSKSKKELLQELLQMEDDDLGELGSTPSNLQVKKDNPIKINDCITPSDDDAPITKPKRPLSEKQYEALKKGQQKRDENREQKKILQKQKEDEERKLIEDKLVKKAISIKKKQIKKQAVLDDISDDETPIQKVKELAAATPTPPQPPAKKIMFV